MFYTSVCTEYVQGYRYQSSRLSHICAGRMRKPCGPKPFRRSTIINLSTNTTVLITKKKSNTPQGICGIQSWDPEGISKIPIQCTAGYLRNPLLSHRGCFQNPNHNLTPMQCLSIRDRVFPNGDAFFLICHGVSSIFQSQELRCRNVLRCLCNDEMSQTFQSFRFLHVCRLYSDDGDVSIRLRDVVEYLMWQETLVFVMLCVVLFDCQQVAGDVLSFFGHQPWSSVLIVTFIEEAWILHHISIRVLIHHIQIHVVQPILR